MAKEAGVPGAAAASAVVGTMTALAQGILAVAGGSLVGAEIVKRTPAYQGMTSEEKLRRGLKVQPSVKLAGEGYEQYMATRRQSVEQKISVDMKFNFDGNLSPAEEGRLIDEWTDAVNEGFVKPLTRQLEESYRH
jgi:hypothetical protein